MAPGRNKQRGHYRERNRKYRLWRYKMEGPLIPCCYCNQPLTFEESSVEHIVPRCLGGRDTIDNRAIACPPCNNRMSASNNKNKDLQINGLQASHP